MDSLFPVKPHGHEITLSYKEGAPHLLVLINGIHFGDIVEVGSSCQLLINAHVVRTSSVLGILGWIDLLLSAAQSDKTAEMLLRISSGGRPHMTMDEDDTDGA